MSVLVDPDERDDEGDDQAGGRDARQQRLLRTFGMNRSMRDDQQRPAAEDVLRDEQRVVEVQCLLSSDPRQKLTIVGEMRSTKGAGQRPMNRMKTMSSAPPAISNFVISLRPPQRSR